jgi:hypothetical protein
VKHLELAARFYCGIHRRLRSEVAACFGERDLRHLGEAPRHPAADSGSAMILVPTGVTPIANS